MKRKTWFTGSLAALATASAFAMAHCSLTASPGDYTSGIRGPGSSDAGDGGPVTHVVVIAGLRDRVSPMETSSSLATADVFHGTIDSNGVVGGWTWEPPAPLLSNEAVARVVGDTLYVVTSSTGHGANFDVAVEWIPIVDRHLRGAWQATFLQAPQVDQTGPTFYGMGYMLLPSGLLTFGGAASVPVGDAGGTTRQWYSDVTFAALDPSAKTFAPVKRTSPMQSPRYHAATAIYKNFVYAVGGQDSVISDDVEVAVLNEGAPGGPLEAFTPTTRLVNPTSGAEHRLIDPAVCTGQGIIYVVGGTFKSQSATDESDIVLMARIDESRGGQLSAWERMPNLPGALDFPGCFVHAGQLYVLGGRGTTERSARVISARIRPDGTLEDWDATTHAPLPAARSQIAVTLF